VNYPAPSRLVLPLQPYELGDYHHFGKRLPFKKILRIIHLGDDVQAAADTSVASIGDGEVVYAEMRAGSAQKKNWGGLVVIGHTDHTTNQPFYSVYGHLYKLTVRPGQVVSAGEQLGYVAPAGTAENGGWKHPHLHFSIYTGPWRGQILPGYKRPTELFRTRTSWWSDPREFIERYNGQRHGN